MKANGFTLVEVIIVMVVIGILLAVAVPNYNQWQQKNFVEKQTRELFADINVARIDSVYRKTRHSIVMNPNNYSMKRYSSADESATAGGTVVFSKDVRYSLSQTSGAFSGEHIVFNTRGLLDNVVDKTIKVSSTNSGAVFDCIVVHKARTNLGKVESNVCVQK